MVVVGALRFLQIVIIIQRKKMTLPPLSAVAAAFHPPAALSGVPLRDRAPRRVLNASLSSRAHARRILRTHNFACRDYVSAGPLNHARADRVFMRRRSARIVSSAMRRVAALESSPRVRNGVPLRTHALLFASS